MSFKRIFLNKNLTKNVLDSPLRNFKTLTQFNQIKFSNQTKKMGNIISIFNPKRFQSDTSIKTQEPSTSSVDQNEMNRFKALSDSWWIENGEFAALHQMNALRVPLVRDTMINYRTSLPQVDREKLLIYTDENNVKKTYTDEELKREPLLGLNILDIGCGGGLFSEPLARLGAQVTAIDALKENIIAAQMRVDSEIEKSRGKNAKFYDRLRYINCTIEDLAAVDENFNYFDAIVCSEVVEHVNNMNDFIANSIKLLKNHGFAFYTTINRTPQSYLLAIIAAEYVLRLAPRGTHTWDKFVKPDELKSALEQNECFVKFKMGMSYNPLTQSWCWSNNDGVNYAVYAQKYQTKLN